MDEVPATATWRENLNTVIALIALVQTWAYFVTTRPPEVAFVLPAGFLLLPSQPFRYNILFNDTPFQQQHVQAALEPLRARSAKETLRPLSGVASGARGGKLVDPAGRPRL